jgi:16S rRNA (guanine966-N2)-methyltransferase
MRIIAGTYKGRILLSVRDRSIRPATDRAKQAIFDVLSNRIEFEGIDVLDLFAGTGSLGLEAISRGAGSVMFVDQSRTSINTIERNIHLLGCQERCTVQQAEVFWFLKNTRRTFDLVFVDPPYLLQSIGELPSAIYAAGILRPSAFVVMEHSKKSLIHIPEGAFEVIRKPFGQTMVLILRLLSMSRSQPSIRTSNLA